MLFPDKDVDRQRLTTAGRDVAWYRRARCGALRSGDVVEVVEIGIGDFVSAEFITYGARWVAWNVPDNVLLGYSSLGQYEEDSFYLGPIVGRVCNRTHKGLVTIGQGTYQLSVNENGNHHHGGIRGFDKHLWDLEEIVAASNDTVAVTMSRMSPSGEQGYPGALSVRVTYTLRLLQRPSSPGATSSCSVSVDIHSHATSADTLANLTTHGYFNLHGAGSGKSVLDHHVTMFGMSHFLPTDKNAIPTGELLSIEASPALDFRPPGKTLVDMVPSDTVPIGYDHFFVRQLAAAGQDKPCEGNKFELPFQRVASFHGNSRYLDISTNQPGFQLYTGNYLERDFPSHGGFCVEPSGLIDAANKRHFGSIEVQHGSVQVQRTMYALRAEEEGP